MHKATLVLTLESDLVLSARAATLGGHAGHDFIPGAALLGWAASQLYGAQDVDSFTLFHSGKVRFGNGLPVTHDGKVAFPVPLALTEQKDKRDGVKGHRLMPQHIRIAPARFPSADGRTEAGESLKPCFVTPDGEVVTPRMGYRLKTAIEKGRAAENQLFGYQHIAAGTRFVASLEADNDGAVAAQTFERLLEVFHNRILALGRSRGAEYGGEIRCQVENGTVNLWPQLGFPPQGGQTAIWLLSDLALDDAYGAPALPPPPDAFGLPSGSSFLDSSTVMLRRYSPFNGYLRRPDLERTVIAAGSVLRYDCHGHFALTAINCSAGFGLYREQGLGRVWINPPLLTGPTPCVASTEFLPAVTLARRGESPAADPYAADLLGWLNGTLAEAAFQKECEDRVDNCLGQIGQLYATARAISGNALAGPGGSQWGRITGLCGTAGLNVPHLRRSLIVSPGPDGQIRVKGTAQPVCKGDGWDDEGMLDGVDALVSFAVWMKMLLAEKRWDAEDGARALQETLGRLAERVRRELVKEG